MIGWKYARDHAQQAGPSRAPVHADHLTGVRSDWPDRRDRTETGTGPLRDGPSCGADQIPVDPTAGQRPLRERPVRQGLVSFSAQSGYGVVGP